MSPQRSVIRLLIAVASCPLKFLIIRRFTSMLGIETPLIASQLGSGGPLESKDSPNRISIQSSISGSTTRTRRLGRCTGSPHYVVCVELDRKILLNKAFPRTSTKTTAKDIQCSIRRNFVLGLCSLSPDLFRTPATFVEVRDAREDQRGRQSGTDGNVVDYWRPGTSAGIRHSSDLQPVTWRHYQLWALRLARAMPTSPIVSCFGITVSGTCAEIRDADPKLRC
jgi:hypothetical protein